MSLVLLVDDNSFNRHGLKLYLEPKGFTVLEAGDFETGQQFVDETPPDIAIIDIVIPAIHNGRPRIDQSLGISLAIYLKQQYPATGVVLFSAYEDRGRDIFKLLQEGVRGIAYKLKGCSAKALLQAIEAVEAGQVLIDPEITSTRSVVTMFREQLTDEERPWTDQLVKYLPELTAQELEVARRSAAGHSLEKIAQDLNLTPKSVENYRSRIYRKVGLSETDDLPASRKIVLLAKALMLYELENKE